MPWDDIIYVSLLLFCIFFGHVYRGITNTYSRQWASTLVGLIVVGIVSGGHIAHSIICTLVNALIVTRLSWRICHLVSFGFTFFYLLGFFRLADWYGLPLPPAHTNLVQMMLTLKMVGLAFEVNSAATCDDDSTGANSAALKKIDFLDIVHYAFSHIGVLTGPYYRYRTYWDSLHRPFADHADHWGITLRKLKQISGFIALHLLSGYYFPAKYALTEEFSNRPFIYRLMYVYPTFVTFRMRIYSGLALSECVCSMAGLGAYPTSCTPIPGLGPKDYKTVELLSSDPEKAKREKSDFETVHNINTWGVETCLTVRTAMKMWNACIQYWMATCVYKRFPYKPLRTAFTMILSALWHGYYAGYYTCICSITFYLPMEDIYMKFYERSEANSLAKKGWGLLVYTMKCLCMAYLAITFQLLRLDEALTYYREIYYAGHVLVAVLYIVGRILKPYVLARTEKKED